MHSNLSPDLQRFVEVAEGNNGFDVSKLTRGALFQLFTESGSAYAAVVTNPKNCEIAITGGRNLKKPVLLVLQGSTFGGSAVKLRWIGIGLRPRLHPLTGGIVTLGAVKRFAFVNDPVRAERIMKKAEARRPKEATAVDLKKWERETENFMVERFSGEHLERIQKLVREFCVPNGRMIMLGILDRAKEARKLEQALAILERQCREHWLYRPPELRGEFITEKDVAYVERAYHELGLPVPG